MEFPTLIPQELIPYQTASSEEALFDALVKNPNDAVLFLEAASDDETWTEGHEGLMRILLSWLTEQTAKNRLSQENYQRAARAIQKHYGTLKSLLQQNIDVHLKDATISLNGILLVAASDFFKQLLTAEARDKSSNILPLPRLTAQEFTPIAAFICTGEVPDLRTKGQEELIELIKRANAWELSAFSGSCEHMLPKYLNVDNVFDMLALAKQERWMDFQQACINFINSRGWGFRLFAESLDLLFFEFLDFHEPTIEFFEQLRPFIQGIICSGTLVDEPQFGLALKECPDLYALDISRTHTFSIQFSEVPKQLQSLNLSECPWLSKDTLKQILNLCPNLNKLILKNNNHLNYVIWGELSKFKQLKKLNLSQCAQIQDADLSLIVKGLPSLTELSISNCKRIGEQGFLDMAKNLSKLVRLDLSRCSISDTALTEIGARCPLLTHVDLTECTNLTEKGINAFKKLALSLIVEN